ncbi:hypothetical protein DINM_020542 [Dirofilaria immitis]|nr:hypothetical protein [Dirofilaria immitis]
MSTITEIKAVDEDDVGTHNNYHGEIRLYLQLLSPYNSLNAQACAVEYFRRLLVHSHIPPPPITDTLIKGLIRCLGVNFGNIQRDAAWALTNCACSPHEICYKIIEHGGLEALVECAAVTDGETRDQVFWAIGNIALDCGMCQRKVKDSAALPLMIGVLVSPTFAFSKWKRNLIWAMSQIFRGGIHTLHIMFMQAALAGLCPVLYLNDEKLKVDAVWTIAYIADDNNDGNQIDAILETPRLLQRLIELLDETETMRAALRALGNLVAGVIIKPKQFSMPAYYHAWREIAWILSNIAAGSHRQIDLLFETKDIVEILIDAFDCDDHRIRKEIGWTVTNALTGASLNRSRWLCGSNVLTLIPQLLTMHTEQDLIDRILCAIELLIAKRSTYIFILESYQIIQTIRQIVQNDNNHSHIKTRAIRILSEENDYMTCRVPPNIYTLIESLCSRFHNNTAYLGVKPIFSGTIDTVRQCRDTCLDLYPYCVAVIFYKMVTLNKSLCYLFNKSSIHKDVILYPEKPLAEHDIINVIEIVADCHEFDAIPPLPNTFITSSDKVSRARRASNIGNPIIRNGLWTRWTNCSNDTSNKFLPSIRFFFDLKFKYLCIFYLNGNASINRLRTTFFLHPSPFHPYPPEPYEHPDDKNEYQRRLAGHMKQLQKSRINCCKRQEWYREHVNKNYIEICRHPCPPSDLLNTDQDFEQIPCNQQQQYTASEEPTSRIQEYNKVQTEEIVIADLLREAQETTEEYQKDRAINHMIIDERKRTHEEEYFHHLQSRQDNETIKPSLINNKENHVHQPITSQNYRHEEHDDYYQQHQKQIKDYSQQSEFINEHDSTFEDRYQEHNRNQQRIPLENDDAGESELDGTDYGYDYDSHDETPVTSNQEQVPTQEISNQFSYHTYPYDTHDDHLNQESHLNRSGYVQNHRAISAVERHYYQQQGPHHLEAPYNEHHRREQEQLELFKPLPDDYHGGEQQAQPSESASDDYYFQQQEQEGLSTVSSQDYHQEQEAQLQPSGFEFDEYYRQQKAEQVQPQLSESEFDEHYHRQQTELSESELDENSLMQQQQEFSTVSPEDYHREQETQPQLSGSEFDDHYHQQQGQPQSSESELDEYYHQRQAQPEPSESELDEYNSRQQQQEFSTISPEDNHREQEAQLQPSGFELDEYYRDQQGQQEQQDFSTVSSQDYHHEQQQAQLQPSGFEVDEYYRQQQAQVQQPSELELDEHNRRQQQQELSTVSPEDYRREQEAQPQASGFEYDEYYRGQQAQQIQPQPSESELDEYYRQQQAQLQPSESGLDEYYRQQQAQQMQPQLSESEFDEYYRRQQHEYYRREQEIQQQPSVPLSDDHYREQQEQQQQYIVEADQNGIHGQPGRFVRLHAVMAFKQDNEHVLPVSIVMVKQFSKDRAISDHATCGAIGVIGVNANK